jgi:hypothetical protein
MINLGYDWGNVNKKSSLKPEIASVAGKASLCDCQHSLTKANIEDKLH